MSSVYMGGSRHPQNINPSQIAAVVAAVVAAGQYINVGCQFGADQTVINSWLHTPRPSLCGLHVFTVGKNPPAAYRPVLGAQITYTAGGTTAPIKARYLLRSIAAFQGCAVAVFFSPGAGSLAVAREAIKAGLPIFAFSEPPPAPIPSSNGVWCISWFMGFQCWAWGKLPEEKQLSFL